MYSPQKLRKRTRYTHEVHWGKSQAPFVRQQMPHCSSMCKFTMLIQDVPGREGDRQIWPLWQQIGEFTAQFACMYDGDDNLLIVDTLNKRLQLMHGEQWFEIKLQPPPFLPTGAVYDGNALYVLGKYPCRIVKYECMD